MNRIAPLMTASFAYNALLSVVLVVRNVNPGGAL